MDESSEMQEKEGFNLSYQGVCSLPSGEGGIIKDANGYKVVGPTVDVPFVEFTRRGHQTTNESPWKMHISIDKDQLAGAWDEVVFPFLAKNGFDHFKVTALNRAQEKKNLFEEQALLDDAPKGRVDEVDRITEGLQVTIYIPRGKEQEYYEAMKGLRGILEDSGCRIGRVDGTEAQLDDNENPISIRYEDSSLGSAANREASRKADKDEVRQRFFQTFNDGLQVTHQQLNTVNSNTGNNNDDGCCKGCTIL